MRRLLLLFAAVVALAGCGGGGEPPRRLPPGALAFPADARWPTPERYRLALAYDARRFRLAGVERIAFVNTGPDPLASVWVRTWGNAFGSCARRLVKVRVQSGGQLAQQSDDCTALEIRLPRPLATGGRGRIELAVAITAPRAADRFGRFAGTAYFGNALPILAVADVRGWALPPYDFRGESFYSLAAAWDARLALPRGTRAATTGRTRRVASGALAAHAPEARDFMIVAGPLRESRRRAGGVVLRRWSVRESRAAARRALRRGAFALRRYQSWFGPYGRRELDLVEGPRTVARGTGIGMEYPELVLTPATPWVLDHEIAHQWFYAIVGNDQEQAPWLDESVASYAASRLEGFGAARCPEPSDARPPVTAAMSTFARAAPRAYGEVIYSAGPCALHRLERVLGPRRMLRALRGVVRTHRDGVLTTAELVAALRDAAPPGVNVDALLKQQRIVA
jgi:Peptidase family M1 domain